MNKTLIQAQFHRAQHTYAQQASVQRTIAAHLASLLASHAPGKWQHILEFGCGTGFLTAELLRLYPQAHFLLNDLMPESASVAALHKDNIRIRYQQGDAEQLDFSGHFDLIASASTIQWFNNPARFVHQCATRLMPHGMLAFSSFLPGNLEEIRQLTGVGLPYLSITQLEQMLLPDYNLLELKEEKHVLHFSSPKEVLRHLSRTGVNGIADFRWTPARLNHFTEQYRMQYQDAQGVRLSYRPVYLLAKKK